MTLMSEDHVAEAQKKSAQCIAAPRGDGCQCFGCENGNPVRQLYTG